MFGWLARRVCLIVTSFADGSAGGTCVRTAATSLERNRGKGIPADVAPQATLELKSTGHCLAQ
jgi:hypothetical protein